MIPTVHWYEMRCERWGATNKFRVVYRVGSARDRFSFWMNTVLDTV